MEDNRGPIASNEPDRVRTHTATSVLESIDREAEAQVRSYATQPERDVSRRIEELEREWDIERVLQLTASALAFTGVVLGVTVDKKWLLLPGGVILPFLFQHAVQGWCPPVPLFRRIGVRTRGEIDGEKFALKALRGDFGSVPPKSEVDGETRASAALGAAST
jgi:Protein of unknown function (DUF2892)